MLSLRELSVLLVSLCVLFAAPVFSNPEPQDLLESLLKADFNPVVEHLFQKRSPQGPPGPPYGSPADTQTVQATPDNKQNLQQTSGPLDSTVSSVIGWLCKNVVPFKSIGGVLKLIVKIINYITPMPLTLQTLTVDCDVPANTTSVNSNQQAQTSPIARGIVIYDK
jgi:hypothetical protein